MSPHNSVLFLLLLLPFLLSGSSASSDTITTAQPLTGDHKLVSEGGSFELGFFKPGNSTYYYIGIWYSLARVPQLTPAWVANRDAPISDHTKAQLKIDRNGNLIISSNSNPLIWSTNITTNTLNSTVAVLLDSGNLVLRDGSDPDAVLWQSIDHPTDTWLPGGKLGRNKHTGEVTQLTSWRSQDDPARGIFTLEIDPNGTSQYYIFWNHTFNYWTSGTWDEKNKIFGNVPEMTANYIYDFEYVSNAKENYFTYSVKNGSAIVTSRFIIDFSGQVKQQTWVPAGNSWIQFWSQPKKQCEVHALCGPFGSCNENAFSFCNCVKGFAEKSPTDWELSDWAGGCVRTVPLLQCGGASSSKAEKDRFFTMPNMRLPDNAYSLQAGSAEDCELGCLNNCSCTAYSYGGGGGGGCSVWYGDLLNLQDGYMEFDAGTIFLRLAASEVPGPKSNKAVVIGAAVGGVAGGLGLLAIAWLLLWMRKRGGGIMSGKSKVVEGGLVAFRYGDLQRATKNFSEKLGGGAFGSVFKGVLPDSAEIAVKKLEGLRQGEKQFRTEVSTIGTIQHVNLVRLRGFCSEGAHKLLVYEYMPNGSLDAQLFPNESNRVLDWRTRYQIALGIARGLTYLHEQCRDCIVHCDIKPENILLDASFVPKVADFGLAKLIGRDFSRVLTTMRGTRGYLAPEWISGVAITAKADVYSYGMMLFEVVSGRRNSEHADQGNKTGFFPTLAASKLAEGDAISVVDGRLGGDARVEEVVRACKVACWCIQDEENSRPSMGQVVQILEGVLEVGMPPIPRALQMLSESAGEIVFFSELSSNSSKTQSSTSASSASRTKSTSSASSKD